MGRIIIITGKGGVGKTSVAAAHALKSAGEGKKTLLVSADMAHNIGDIFNTCMGGHPAALAEGLDGLELDPDRLLREEFPEVAEAVGRLFEGGGVSASDFGSGFMIPGFENLFSLLKIAQLYESGAYERIIVDCAPTGETLSLLKLPELLAWYMEKFFPVGKTMVRALAPVSKLRYHVTLPDREAMDGVERLHLRLLELQRLLKNPAVSSARLVCVPEKMVVEETKRNYMYLNLYGYRTDGVFINRVLPQEADNRFLRGWRKIQKTYLDELHSVFGHLPISEIPWYAEELRGIPAIRRVCDTVLTDPALFDVRETGETEVYESVEGGYRLLLRLPGAEPGSVTVRCHDMDLDITAGGFLRRIPLPNLLRGVRPSKAALSGDILRITFPLDAEKTGRAEK